MKGKRQLFVPKPKTVSFEYQNQIDDFNIRKKRMLKNYGVRMPLRKVA